MTGRFRLRLSWHSKSAASEAANTPMPFHARSTRSARRSSKSGGRFPARVVAARYAGIAMTFTRITVRADQMGGLPCIRGLRIPVATVVGMVADGLSPEEIVADYPDLEPEDVSEALRYAAEAVRERELPLVASG